MKLLKLFRRHLESLVLDEDLGRREFILNIATGAIITLLSVALLSTTLSYVAYSTPETRSNNRLSFSVLFLLIALFVCIFRLSRKGRIHTASYLLLSVLFVFASYLSYSWGIELPAAILFDVLVIVMAGILVSTRLAFYAAGAVCLSVLFFGILQQEGVLVANQYWMRESWDILDTLVTAVILTIIATVSWLSNREIERSLRRAHLSEAALKEERDLLELRVEERTRELRQVQMEQMTQAYRFVEFGRLAGGLFHDLSNPLTALALNINRIADSNNNKHELIVLSQDISRAKSALSHMQTLMESLRRHLMHEGIREQFSVRQILEELVRTLRVYAREYDVRLELSVSENIELFGDSVAFTQALTNIISNAIEAYAIHGDASQKLREVAIFAVYEADKVRILIRDFGPGIPEAIREKIFEPFFTTKSMARGLGIGLPLAKRVIEREFGGTIVVHSSLEEGSSFVILLPIRGLEP